MIPIVSRCTAQYGVAIAPARQMPSTDGPVITATLTRQQTVAIGEQHMNIGQVIVGHRHELLETRAITCRNPTPAEENISAPRRREDTRGNELRRRQRTPSGDVLARSPAEPCLAPTSRAGFRCTAAVYAGHQRLPFAQLAVTDTASELASRTDGLQSQIPTRADIFGEVDCVWRVSRSGTSDVLLWTGSR